MLYGDTAADDLAALQDLATSGEEQVFAADIVTALDLKQVVVERFVASQIAGHVDHFAYRMRLVESPELPEPATLGPGLGFGDLGFGDLGLPDLGLPDLGIDLSVLGDIAGLAGDVAGAVDAALDTVDTLQSLVSACGGLSVGTRCSRWRTRSASSGSWRTAQAALSPRSSRRSSTGEGTAMLTLGHTLVLGDREFTSHVVHVRCERSVAPGVGLLRARLPYVGDLPAAVGDDVRLDLDSGDPAAGSATVFTGTIAGLRHTPDGVDVLAGDASWTLAQFRPATTYEGQTADAVISALAGDAGASAGSLADGPTLPAYVDDGAPPPAAGTVAQLAAWSGADAYVTADGDVAPGPGRVIRRRARCAGGAGAAAGSTEAALPASGVAARG